MRRFSEHIRRFATEASHMEITKENFYELYNMALLLLKSVDSLDPDKTKKNEVNFILLVLLIVSWNDNTNHFI